ncbi:ZIP family metal transporter [Alicyclobacillus fastidiosus]|uniref:ZIP family metal transporter n=1 Tax=Alicyclobacillus fastidiosus TaxID=392011 RepID=A0ABV5AEV2_9BACL|nr:ZIP family metal transporter [Alicyclobacillus fastidiosus]WEH09463.1 ZIP family metal transporter [Alicyclobacillus fastidiosus]
MWFALILCTIAAFADVIGGAVTVVKRLSPQQTMIVTGLGAGFLLGATVLDRLPDSLSELPTAAPLYIVIGYLVLLIFERYSVSPMQSHFASHGASHHNTAVLSSKAALVSFLGLLLHTFMDGVIIAGAFTMSRATGVLIFVAITMHKIPEGFSMATITLASGTSRARALLTSVGLAVSTLIGAVITLEVGNIDESVVKILMALATGTFLYVSMTDLMPVVKGQNKGTVLAAVIGVGVFYVSLLLIKHVGLS